MRKYTTQYFGEISIDITTESLALEYKTKKIVFSFINFNNAHYTDVVWSYPEIAAKLDYQGNVMRHCVEKINRYPYIDEKTRRFFIDNFSSDRCIRQCFKNYFDMLEEEQIMNHFGVKSFDEVHINTIVEKFDYPNLIFEYDQGSILTNVDYTITDISPEIVVGAVLEDSMDVISYGYLRAGA